MKRIKSPCESIDSEANLYEGDQNSNSAGQPDSAKSFAKRKEKDIRSQREESGEQCVALYETYS